MKTKKGWKLLLRKHLPLTLFAFLSACCAFTQAQEFNVSEVSPISIGTTLSFHSNILSEDRKILVSLPDDYASSSKRYPVIYLLDAQYFFQFQYAYGVINALSFLDEIPKVILVGIHSEDREMDMMTAFSGRGGNADKFTKFLGDELQVFMAQQYRTEPYDILIGHSAGGFFALRTLLYAPDTFNAYVALDPALWWEDGSLVDEFHAELDAGREFSNALFTSISGQNGGDDDYYEEFIRVITEELPDGLNFRHTTFPDEDHSSTTMPGIQHGILSVYEDWVPPGPIDSLDALVSHYLDLSKHYGYSVSVPVTAASDVGFKLINNGNPEGALEIFEYALANLSQDAIAHYQVGFASRMLGRLEQALAAFEKAVELGPGTDMFDVYVRFRDEVSEEIAALEDVNR